jgi:hypothetical protein
MVTSAPGEPNVEMPTSRTLAMFKKIMEDMWDIQANKSKAMKEKKRLNQVMKQTNMTQQFKRVQRFLGLRVSDPKGDCTLKKLRLARHCLSRSLIGNLADVAS